jgi:hypothetical protein
MTEENQLAVMTEEITPQPELQVANGKGKPPPDAKALRTEAVGALLSGAYAGASTLKLKPNEVKDLTEPFPDDAIEIRPFDGIIYISHMLLRERLWKVFGPTEVAEICRERFMRPDSNEIAVDLVLMVRGKFVAEGVGTAKYYPNNAKGSFGDTVESAWSEALRRCAKKLGVGTAVWRPDYVRRWIADNAVEKAGKWYRKDDPRIASAPKAKGREYTLTPEKPVSEFQKMKAVVQAVGEPETDESTGIPF